MGIVCKETEGGMLFKLDTPNSSYMFRTADKDGFILHLYYGKRISDTQIDDLARITEPPFLPSDNERERCSFMDCAPFEYPGHGLGDYRDDAFSVISPDGYSATSVSYRSHRIIQGKPKLNGLPATFATGSDCTTLEITAADEANGLEIILYYSVFEDVDAVARSIKIRNAGTYGCLNVTDADAQGVRTADDAELQTGPGEISQTMCQEVAQTMSEARVNTMPEAGSDTAGKPDPAANPANTIKLTKVLSTCVEFRDGDYDTITLHGSWARERMMDREHLGLGKRSVSSLRGESSHQEHPFIALLDHDANEDHGNVYGFSFVYSGNFIAQAEKSQFDSIRVMMGINPVDFCWNLKPGEEFQAPEVISVYSDEGIGKMSRTFHDLYRSHLIRSKYKDCKRPILINNWEATYFDFNTEKLISIAKQAKELGIEMLVMDDGWFGHRNDDSSSLGDWFVNENKLNGGLKHLVDEVNRIGLKFGIWMEPEMISPDSELYRAHPDWAIHIPGRKPTLSRAQLVLDLSRLEVVEYTFGQVEKILKSANIAYLKWDMNRQLTDIGSAMLGRDGQGELFHRYCLGVYSLQERLITEFPDLLLENCSGGGARFDPGMLYYSPQVWTSDDMDPVMRLQIQQGTALIYPLSTMGAHVCDCPNHSTGRTTPFETRGYVALAGTFGYELDVTRIPETDRNMIPAQVAMYHRYNDLVRTGDYHRVASYLENHEWDCWEVVSKDKTEALVTIVNVLGRVNHKSRLIRLKGLDPDKTYSLRYYNIGSADEDEEYLRLRGDTLMYAGINATGDYRGDFKARLLHLKEV